MATQNTHGIILRTSCNFFGRYAYFPLPQFIPSDAASNFDIICTNSLAKAPHFPDINILDTVCSNILYQTYNSFPNVFHVYNLINRSYFAFSFPFLLTFVNAAILIRDSSHFKVLVVCINEHPNPFFNEEGSDRPLVFYIYTYESNNWSLVPIDYDLTSNRLLPNRRNPAHAGQNIIYFDLTDRFLVTFAYCEEKIEPIPKFESIWEKESKKFDEDTRYFQSKGRLHCVKFNPIKVRFEVYIWMELPKGLWRLVAQGRDGTPWKKVIGIHPDDASYLFMRSIENDEISLVNIRWDFSYIVIDKKGPTCTPQCFAYGMNDVLEEAISKGVQSFCCGILHPHENIEGPEGEVFIVSNSGSQLVFPPHNMG